MNRSVLLILALAGANEPISATPPNDDCVNAIPISGEGVFSFDSTGATTVDPPPTSCSYSFALAGNGFAADVWFCWTAECTGDVTVDTCGGTTVDTKLAVYDECVCPPDVLEGCDDDGCLFQSRVSLFAVSGQTYLIRIGTQPGLGGGMGTFRIACEPPFPPPDGVPNCPCSGNTNPRQAFDTCNARDRWDAYNSTRGQFEIVDEFVPDYDGHLDGLCWWGTYARNGEPCERGLVDFFEITYYADDCGAPGPIIAGPFSQEDVTMEVIGPIETYESFPNGAFEYQYSARHDPLPVVTGAVYWIAVSNSNYNNCAWYWETALGAGGHAIQLDDADHASAVVRADLAFCFRLVESNGPVCFPPPSNDDCADALPLAFDDVSFDTIGATTDGPVNVPVYGAHPPPCDFALGDEQVHKDVWFDLEAPCSGTLRIGLCDSAFDTKLAVYEGADCPPTDQAIACNDDACGSDLARQSQVLVAVTERGRYKVRVGGYAGAWGTGTLSVAYAAPVRATLSDFARFARCFTGPCRTAPCDLLPGGGCCITQDFDGDGDVDGEDYAAFHAVLTGP
jgi:hypothetical protein